MSMTWLLLGALALAGFFVLAVVFSVFGFLWFMVTLPFRLIGLLLQLPFVLFGLAIAGIVIALLVFVPVAFLLMPALVVLALAYGIWRLVRRDRNKAIHA
jgi:hypothetical protein